MKQQSLHIPSVCAVCRFILYQGLCGQLRPEWQWYEVICCFCNVGCEGAVDSCYFYQHINNKSKGLIFLILSQRLLYSFSIENVTYFLCCTGKRDIGTGKTCNWQSDSTQILIGLSVLTAPQQIPNDQQFYLFVLFTYVQYCAFTSVQLFSARYIY